MKIKLLFFFIVLFTTFVTSCSNVEDMGVGEHGGSGGVVGQRSVSQIDTCSNSSDTNEKIEINSVID